MDNKEPWVELEYCDKHEFESLPCRDCRIKELEAELDKAEIAYNTAIIENVRIQAKLDALEAEEDKLDR